MRSTHRPGDLPLPRPLRRGHAAVVYKLGFAAGERAGRREYWEIYAAVMNDLGGIGGQP